MKTDEELLAEVNEVIKILESIATELGPDAVAVKGDARFYGPSVYVTFPDGASMEQVARISTEITNKVRGIARVMFNITPS